MAVVLRHLTNVHSLAINVLPSYRICVRVANVPLIPPGVSETTMDVPFRAQTYANTMEPATKTQILVIAPPHS